MSTVEPRSLLLVEDEALFRRLIVKHLTRQGHQVTETADAESALRAYYLQEFDSVITDVHLPGMSGLELALAMRDIHPHQPIVFVTGDVDEALANEALAQGGAGYLLKPFKFFELDAALRQSLAAAVPGPSRVAPLPPGGVGAPPIADEDSWRIEQRRLLAAAASKPVEFYIREAPSGPRAGTVPFLLRLLAVLVVVLLAAWAVGYWIGRNGERANEQGDPNAPGAGTIYVPTAPRERERAPDRRPRNP